MCTLWRPEVHRARYTTDRDRRICHARGTIEEKESESKK